MQLFNDYSYNNFAKCWNYRACVVYDNSSQCAVAFGIGESFKTKKDAITAMNVAVEIIKSDYTHLLTGE